jgi:hypothetical protein
VYFIFDIVSFDISWNIAPLHDGSPLLCLINAILSSSYVFKLPYPRVLHYRIVSIQKLKTLVALVERKKRPITLVLLESRRSNLKVARKFAKTPLGLHNRQNSNLTKYIIYIVFLWFMIKIINICVFLDYSLFRLFKNGRCQNPEMAGICRNITVYPGISRYIPEFREICRNFAELYFYEFGSRI